MSAAETSGNDARDAREARETATEKQEGGETASGAAARPAQRDSLKGLSFRRVYSDPSVSPYDAIEWELRTAAITNEKGEMIFEQKNVEVPKSWSMTATNIVAQKYFHGRLGTPERETLRPAADRAGRRHDHGLRREGRLLPDGRGPRRLPRRARGDPRQPGRLASTRPSGSTSASRRSRRPRPASSTPCGDSMGVDPRPRQDRGDALQVRLGHRLEPLLPALLDRGPLLRRHRVRAALVHEGLRLLRRRDQVGRQDAPRREDGDPERRPPRHRRLHRLQGERGAEGLGADRRRLRRLVQRRGLRVDLLPERQPLRARDGRVHAGGRE